MALETQITGKNLTVTLDDELTIYTANEFRDALAEQLQGMTHIVINLSKVTEMDSAGLQLLFAIKNLNAEYDVEFIEHSSAKGTPESFLKLARSDVINMRKFMSDLAKQLNLNELKIDNTSISSEEANSIEVRGRSRGT